MNIEQYNPDHMLEVMNTYAGVFPKGFHLAENRRGRFNMIIPTGERTYSPTFTNYECLVRYLDRKAGINSND